MYNWTNDLPEGSRDVFIEMLNKFNEIMCFFKFKSGF